MISYYLVIILIGLINVLIYPITFLPDVTLPANIQTAFVQAGFYFGMIWNVAPVTLVALFASIVVIVGIETKIFSYKTIKWIYNKIPGVN